MKEAAGLGSTENILELLLSQAERVPDRKAIIDKHGSMTFKELVSAISSRATYFKKVGLRSGDRVLVFMPMSISLYIDCLAVFGLGATVVFLDEWVDKKRLNLCCEIARCRAFIAPLKIKMLGFVFSSGLREIPIKITGGKRQSGTPDGTIAAKQISEQNETALITFTTGSTGRPKAVKRTHRFLLRQFNALSSELNLEGEEVNMTSLPIVLLINLAGGITSVIPDWKSSKPKTIKPKIIWNQIQNYEVSRITASPFFLESLAKYQLKSGRNSESVTKLFTGGAPVFPGQAQKISSAFSNGELKVVYGSTEAEPISVISGRSLMLKEESMMDSGLCVGTLHDNIELKIIQWKDQPLKQNDLEELELPLAEIGEIVVSGEHVLDEYFDSEEAFRRNKIVVDGVCWHRTGDGGRISEEGLLFLTGRCSQEIEHNGKKYHPFLIEYSLSKIRGVELGTMLEINGEPNILVQLQRGASQEDLTHQIQKVVGKFKVGFVDFIPRDKRHFSKIDYQELLDKNLW
ncbi:MAG: AMP-binding protein [Flavobacteriales bacterium]|nr:AMP-binding protein [Flavobacteriales bacterium]